jgi:putative intracellular protease/amidase
VRIAILLYDGVTALDAIGPYEVLSRVPGAVVHFVGKRAGPIPTDSGMLKLHAELPLAQLTDPEVLVVPGGVAGTFAAARDPEILEWVRQVHARSRWTTSVCSGALILGAAGLLRGKQATTHWAVADRLGHYGATYGSERVIRQGRIVTAQGVSAGIDMGLYLAAQLEDEQTAEAIQLVLEYDPVPPFDSGSLHKASAPVRRRAERMLRKQLLREMGSRLVQSLARPFARR